MAKAAIRNCSGSGMFLLRSATLAVGMCCTLGLTCGAQSSADGAQVSSDLGQQVQRATEAQRAGDVQGAIAAYKAALKLQPQTAELWSNLGLMQHQAGDRQAALESFSKAHRLQPKLFVPVLFLGIENLDAGKPVAAIPNLEQAQRLNPGDANVPLYLSRAYFDAKDFERAEAVYKQATLSNPKDGEAWYRLGLTHLEQAERDAGKLAKEHRQSPYFSTLEADAMNRQDRLDRAETIYRQVLQEDSKPPCLHSALGFALLQQNKGDEAESEFKQDITAGGCSIAQLGLLRIAFDRNPAAADLSSLGKLWKADPGFVENYLPEIARGMTAEQFAALNAAFDRTTLPGISAEDRDIMKGALHGATAAARMERIKSTADTRRALEQLRSGEYQACVNHLLPAVTTLSQERLSTLATCAFYTGDYSTVLAATRKMTPAAQDDAFYWSIRAHQEMAARSLVKAGEAEPNAIRMHALLGESYRDMGRYGAAEEEFATALQIDPGDFAVLIGAAATYLQEYRLEPAWQMIERALSQRPNDPEAQYIAGEILMDQHRYDDAEPHLKHALVGKVEFVSRIHALLGTIYFNQGRDEQAIEELKQGLASDDDGSVHFQLGRLYQKTGQKKLADAEFAETRRLQSSK